MTKIVDQGSGAIELSEDELDSISAGEAKKPAPTPKKKPASGGAPLDYLVVKMTNVIIS